MVTATPHEDVEAALASAETDASARLARSGHIAKDEYGPISEGWQMTVGYGHSGFGIYAHLEEYPEEGSVFFRSLDDIQRDAYAEGRKDEREEVGKLCAEVIEAWRTSPLRSHDGRLFEAVAALAQAHGISLEEQHAPSPLSPE